MRCPECNTRNSVAAHTCIQCGYKFKRKSLPPGIKIAVCAVIVCGALWATATYILPSVVDPEKNLRNIAKRVAAGPKSPGESVWLLRQFNGSIERYLEKFGELPSPQLNADLRKLLPTSAFEVYVVNLPQHLKLVEVDTLLQGNSFLLMNTAATNDATKVIPVHGMEVYEDSRLISDAAGPILVLLGHSSGQPPHTPQVKVFALLPADASDESEKSVPHIVGQGTARFIGSSHDIAADLSLVSIGQLEGVLNNVTPRDDTIVNQFLTWTDNKYTGHRAPSLTPLGALYTMAYCMQDGDAVAANESTLGTAGMRFVKEHHSDQPCNFKVDRVKVSPTKVQYALSSDRNERYDVVVARSRKAGWRIASAVVAAPMPVVADQSVPGQVATQAAKVSEAVMSVAQPEKPQPPEAVTGKQITQNEPEKKEASAPVVSSSKGAGVSTAKTTHGSKLASSQLPSAVWVDSAHKAVPQPKLPEKLIQASKIVQEIHMPSTPMPKPPAQMPHAAAAGTEIAVDGATLRSGPSAKTTAITHMLKGQKIEVIGKRADGWYKVSVNGQQGYVFGELISGARSVVQPKGAVNSTRTAGTNKALKSSGTSTRTTKVAATTSTNKSSSTVSNAPAPSTAAPKETSSHNSATIVLSYKLHDFNHKPIAPLTIGERVKVIGGLEGNRYQVQLPDGTTGYVDKDALDFGGGAPKAAKTKTAAKSPTPPQFVP